VCVRANDPNLPTALCRHGEVLLLPDGPKMQAARLDLAAVENGGKILGFSDTHYGHPKNLINPGRSFNMGDGWETARRLDRPPVLLPDADGHLQVPGNEWTVIQLGIAGTVEELLVQTTHFKGNFPESVRLEATCNPRAKRPTGVNLDADEVEKLGTWHELVPRSKLKMDADFPFKVAPIGPMTHIRVTIWPDGGIARLRVFGKPDATLQGARL
jgi:allantoicase